VLPTTRKQSAEKKLIKKQQKSNEQTEQKREGTRKEREERGTTTKEEEAGMKEGVGYENGKPNVSLRLAVERHHERRARTTHRADVERG
jgi:CRISPR/Cas system-associated endonuclease Cas1